MKYIIELKDDVQVVQKVGVTENGNAFVMNFYKDQLEELTADYINEHYGQLQDEAYQRGLDDAWEAAKKISLMPPDEIEKVFPGAAKYNRYNLGYSGVEAIAKLKAYEEQKADDEIKVGDEVERSVYGRTEGKGIYLEDADEEGDWLKCLFWTGATFTVLAYPKEQFKKTGRHFDIASILKEMQS